MNRSVDSTMLSSALPYKPAVETSYALADPIIQYICGENFVSMMRAVFKAKLFHPIAEVYRYTRTYEQGLSVAGYLIETLNECIYQVTAAEWNEWMMPGGLSSSGGPASSGITGKFLSLALTALQQSSKWLRINAVA